MLKHLKNGALQMAKGLGVFAVVANSRWRRGRLLILCYHGISLRDEHEWRNLFVTPAFFRRRLEILSRGGYRVLPLAGAVRMLREESLPPKSVAITFDDGFHDFHQHGFPLLREFGFPATVYQTTYYSDYPYPVFNLMLSYLFWRGGGRGLADGAAYGVPGPLDLSDEAGRARAVNAFLDAARAQGLTPAQKDEVAAQVACELGVDYPEILRLRMLQLMTASQISEIAAGGVDVELHTHRHRTPLDEGLFVREIRDNRQWLAARTGTLPNHFCYPSGVHRDEFLPWLRAEGVESATTCETGLATRQCDPLLLPRLLDSMNVTDVDFEGWLAGVSAALPHRGA
jgi:peptidoglycan/xylan/chitin deacetylase (PgdA/CDA1 family)